MSCRSEKTFGTICTLVVLAHCLRFVGIGTYMDIQINSELPKETASTTHQWGSHAGRWQWNNKTIWFERKNQCSFSVVSRWYVIFDQIRSVFHTIIWLLSDLVHSYIHAQISRFYVDYSWNKTLNSRVKTAPMARTFYIIYWFFPFCDSKPGVVALTMWPVIKSALASLCFLPRSNIQEFV